jgi:hypothetical protein
VRRAQTAAHPSVIAGLVRMRPDPAAARSEAVIFVRRAVVRRGP